MSLSFVIFASGTGTNADALMEFAARESKAARCLALISDRAEAPALEKARKRGIEAIHIPAKDMDGQLAVLARLRPDWACLAGYMRILKAPVLDFFQDDMLGCARVLNIHPSLLPAFPGMRAYEQAFAAGVPEAGITVHIVDEKIDNGPILMQRKYRREAGDDFETFMARGRALENDLYVDALRAVASGRFELRSQSPREGA